MFLLYVEGGVVGGCCEADAFGMRIWVGSDCGFEMGVVSWWVCKRVLWFDGLRGCRVVSGYADACNSKYVHHLRPKIQLR